VGNIIKMLVAGMMFMLLTKFNFGRNLLIKVVRCMEWKNNIWLETPQ
jgi:hypothetical protein